MQGVTTALSGSGAFAVTFLVSLVLLAVFAALYSAITSHSEMALIRAGNKTAALSFGGAIIGFVIPVGKAVAMDMILSGRMLGAEEARQLGLVARVVPQDGWLDSAKQVAREIASKSPVSVRLAKEAVDEAFETPLSAGIDFERRSFYLARASEDADEGLSAFIEKRKPEFRGK